MIEPSTTHYVINAAGPLQGTVAIGGAKNSVLKLMAATTMADGTYTLYNVPNIHDVSVMCRLLESMGATTSRRPGVVEITIADLEPVAPFALVEQMRASTAVLGPLLGRFNRVELGIPGGDDFGHRPIDMHLTGLETLGASFTATADGVSGTTDGLVGGTVRLAFPSVGATENILMASVLAKGTTTIRNAAAEPEISDLASFLNKMGARISGSGTSTITVEGVDALEAVTHRVIPDRIQSATYMAAVGIAGGEVVLEHARYDHMAMVCQKMGEMGLRISPDRDGIWVSAPDRMRSVDISTLPYPGVATDYKPALVALLAVADGTGIVTENLFAGRFRYVDELVAMGANIRTDGNHAIVRGVERLQGATVTSHDIRAGAALIVAALGADGETTVVDEGHVVRGYPDLAGDLTALGANVVARAV
ncbi:MAG: UDP-N-acetylglucosamine 1-carboxyvinyltransferase [Acidimicrobiales bacterium]|nr:UDP-N-acetylglucosamine 1-carboxyvinyltransferase [Acidimicrobiales bacterium]RZV47903.1 MAG: UDP-N-acetylglucosamine 1-carboxyvinyltransferase [Acidimicrobiales bacterium]